MLVALSGGVDSAVAALLERERGANVVAVTLKLWSDQRTDAEKSCCSPLAVLGARRVAHSLGIPHLTLDLETAFRERVVGAFIDGYRAGETPNPCVLCNGDLRIDAMLALAERLGCSALATGHYARVVDDGQGPLLAAADDAAKDQTYMLSGLRSESLARLRFPLAALRKTGGARACRARPGSRSPGRPRVRTCAFSPARASARSSSATAASASARARSSTSRANSSASIGGHHLFTVGQRRGLGVGGSEPLYVLGTDARENTVTVGPRERLARRTVRVRGARLHRPGSVVDRVRLRYHSAALPCSLAGVAAGEHEELELELGEPAYGVAPGQTACLMAGDLVVGRATIA